MLVSLLIAVVFPSLIAINKSSRERRNYEELLNFAKSAMEREIAASYYEKEAVHNKNNFELEVDKKEVGGLDEIRIKALDPKSKKEIELFARAKKGLFLIGASH